MFREAGAVAVERCSTLRSAVAALRDRTPAAAVLDIRLGRDTTSRLVELLVDGDIPFIFYSGQTIPPSVLEKTPNAILVSKPGKKKLLVQTLVDLLARRREVQQGVGADGGTTANSC
jgi:DNA-binding NtrC family response regulator